MGPINGVTGPTVGAAAAAPDSVNVPQEKVIPPEAEKPKEEVPDSSSASVQRMERGLEASYVRGELNRSQPGGIHAPHKTHTPAASPFLGMRLGTNQDGVDVRVKREIGDTKGYDDRLQAIAVARMGGADPAAVIQSADGKWHAVETNANFYSGNFAAADNPARQVQALPSSAYLEQTRKEFVELRKEVRELDKMIAVSNGPVRKGLEDARDELNEKLTQSRDLLAELVFAVPRSELRFEASSTNAKEGKINVIANLPGADGVEGPVFGQGGNLKDRVSAIQISLDMLEKPGEAEGVLFHETAHLKDEALAKQWVATYEHETKRPFVDSATRPFEDWMRAQAAAGRLSKADADLVTDVAMGERRTSEAGAFVHASLSAIKAGAPEVAISELERYASKMNTEHHRVNGGYENPNSFSNVPDALTRELQEAYKHMTRPMQQQLEAAIAKAKAANPEAWISHVTFSK